nr:DUF4214 domain-containing protein [uncultured Undibacterium sp.]
MRLFSTRQLSPLMLCLVGTVLSACGGNADLANEKVMAPPQELSAAPANLNTFAAVRNNYKITRTAAGFSVKDNVGSGGTINISTTGNAKFSDVSVNFSVGDKSKTITAANLKTLIELYVAFFNRVPDADGMSFWIDKIKAGMTVDQLSSNFYDAAVGFTSITGYSASMTNEEFVRIIYKNVLGRSGTTAPPDADVAFWAGELASKRSSRGNLVATMLNAAHEFAGNAEWGWVPQLLDNKVAVGNFFAIQQGLNYNSPEESISKGMEIAKAVTPTDTSAAKAKIGVTDVLFDLTAGISNSEFEKVQTIVNARCISCHSTQRTEGGIALHTADLIRRNAGPLYISTVVTRSMPQDGALSAVDIADIQTWFLNGAK